MPFMGIQFLPGAPSDPTQAEAPSLPELLGTLASNIYGGDPRYSAASGIGQGFADIFGGMRTKRDEVRQFQQLKKTYPDMPLVPGMKMPTFGEILQLQQQKDQAKLIEQLSTSLEGGAGGLKPGSIPLKQLVAAKGLGIDLPARLWPSAMGGSGLTKTQEMVAGNIGLVDANGQPRQPQNQEEWQRLTKATGNYLAGIASGKTGAEQQTKKDIAGMAPYLNHPVPRRLVDFGLDPTKVEPGDPMLAEAEESVGIEDARKKITSQEKLIRRAVVEAGPLMDQMKSYIDEMRKKGLPLDHDTIADEWRKFHMMTQGGFMERGVASPYIFGEPRPEYQKLFSMSGMVRSRLSAPYMGSGMPRSQKVLQTLQQHMPQENESDTALIESLNVIRPLVNQLYRDYLPTQDPVRAAAIKKLTGQTDPNTGRKITAKYAEYIIDKRLGVTPDYTSPPAQPYPSAEPPAPAAPPTE